MARTVRLRSSCIQEPSDTWRYFPCDDVTVGGLLIHLSDVFFNYVLSWEDIVLIPGRLVRSRFTVPGGLL